MDWHVVSFVFADCFWQFILSATEALEYFFCVNKSVGEYSGCIAAKFNALFHLLCLYDLL